MIRVFMTAGALVRKNSGGPSISIPQICEHLADQGVGVDLGYSADPRADGAWVPTKDLRIRRRIYPSLKLPGMKNPIYPGLAATLMRLSREQGTQIIHDNGIWTGSNRAAAVAARACSIPLVLTPRGMLTRWALGQRSLKKKAAWWVYQRRICQQARLLHATSQDEAADLRALGLTNPIAVIANGVQIPRFTGKPPRPKDGKRRLLFLSRIHPKKGLLSLVRATAALRRALTRGRWIVTIAGPDENGYLAEVKQEISRLGVEDLVEFDGFIQGDEKWDLYRSSELFVLPTFSENFGLVIAEALGCGIPVVTTQGTPWNELLTHRCGWWHPIGQEALESSLGQALSTPAPKLREMGERGRSLVRSSYEWKEIAQRLKLAYEWILDRAPKPKFIQ